MQKLKLFLFLCLFQGLGSAFAQVVFCPDNIDFEHGNFASWNLDTGHCCPLVVVKPSGAIANRHVITSGSAIDTYGKFPIVAPGGGSYSLKLGNDIGGHQAEGVRYYVHVPNNLNNYSLILRYAVVLQDGGHTAAEQPRFDVLAYDSSSNIPITCVQFNFVASASIPGFTKSTVGKDVYYKSWSTTSLNLSGYAGKTIKLNIMSGDCNLTEHFGYGYVDVNCGLFQISGSLCKGANTAALSAPAGFQSYKWYDSTFTTLLGSTQSITAATHGVYNKYAVILTPYTGFGCPDTLTTVVKVSDISVQLNNDTTICHNQALQLKDSVNASIDFQPITYDWVPQTGLSCNNCLNPIAKPLVQTNYVLTATDASGCKVKDSLIIYTAPFFDIQPKDKIQCKGSKAMLYAHAAGSKTISYQWKKNGVNITGATRDTLNFDSIDFKDTATYTLMATGTCDSVLSEGAKLQIYAMPQPNLPDTTLVCHINDTISAGNFLHYLWSTGAVTSSIKVATQGIYWVKVTEQHLCTNFDTTYVQINSLPIIQLSSDTTLCNEIPLLLHAQIKNYDSFSWLESNDGSFSNVDMLNPVFTPVNKLNKVIKLLIQAQNNCGIVLDSLTIDYRARLLSAFWPIDTSVCEGSAPVLLHALNSGGKFNGANVNGSYFNPLAEGKYKLTYQLQTFGCIDSAYRYINVMPTPVADFIFNAKQLSIDSAVTFTSTSKKEKSLLWDFGNGDADSNKTASYRYYAEGNYAVTLTAINGFCQNSITKFIMVDGSAYIWVPNVFTPNGDGLNDFFEVIYHNKKGGILSIYDRWGELLYKSADLSKGWDGYYKGKMCKSDVYIYIVDYLDNSNTIKTLKGNVTLLD